MLTAAHLRNQVPRTALDNATPLKALYGKGADFEHLRIINAKNQEAGISRLGRTPRWLQYEQRVYHSGTRRVRESQNVIFIETPSATLESNFVSRFDEGIFSYDEPEDIVRDVRNYA